MHLHEHKCLTFLWAGYLCVFPIWDAGRNLPLLLLLDCHLQKRRTDKSSTPPQLFTFFSKHQKAPKSRISTFFKANSTFLLGECITGAGGEGGPLGIFLFILQQTIINVIHIHTPFAILVEYENTGINIHTNSFYPKIHSNRLLTNVNKKVFWHFGWRLNLAPYITEPL